MAPEGLTTDTLVLDGRFRILRRLGAGGMGEVYLAEQVSLRRKVALKVLRRDLDLLPGALERFRREALLLSSVDHPAVVRVIDFGESGGAPCLVMELVEGEPLDVVLGQGPLAPERAVPLLAQLAEGLAAIHDKGIVHRDLKPDNIILTRGPGGEQARLLDFGIARLADPSPEGGGVTQGNLVLGTPEYLSPEQAIGLTLDARTDIYSLGVVAFRVLSGALPFAGPSGREYMAQHAAQPPLRLDEASPALSELPGLGAVVMRCLEKDLGKRYATGRELARALLEPEVLRRVEGSPGSPGTRAVFGARASPSAGTVAEGLSPSPPPAASSGTAMYGSTPPAPAVTPGGGVPVGGPVRTTGGEAPVRRPSGGMRPTSSTGGMLRTQNLTVMLTDIAGFTERTSSQTREENAWMMKEHDRLLLPVLRAFSGRLQQRRGDALLVTFKSPTESVLCGMAIQDALWRYNAAQPEPRRIPVRVAIHLGEVLVDKDSLLGEPMAVVEAVEAAAQAGEVVFTEAVRLSMNKAEAPAEEHGAIDVPGRNERLRLYRCTAAAGGPPFGGRDGGVKRSFTGERPAVRLPSDAPPGTASAEPPAPGSPGLTRRRAIAAGVGAGLLALFAALTFALWSGSPAKKIRRALEAGQARRALQLAEDTCAAASCPAELRSLKAAALHGLGRHKEELAVVAGLVDLEMARLDPLSLSALAEDYGRGEGLVERARSPEVSAERVRAQLGRAPTGKVVPTLKGIADGPVSAPQWGALRYLDASKAADGLNLVSLYTAALDADDCKVRAAAARRLGELGDVSAKPALNKLATTPRKKGLSVTESCGQDEAITALRKLDKD